MIWTTGLPYFPPHELACKCCGEIKLDLRFAAMLPALRAAWKRPLSPTSVCRCGKHNAAVGGHPTSFHLIFNPKWPTEGTAAADIAWRGWKKEEKMQFARLAQSQGFRLGLHDGFLHLDLGRQLGLPRTPFLYGTWSGEFAPEDVL